MARYSLDTARTRVTVRTVAQGLFSPLAHDLELDSRGWTGTAEVEGEKWEAKLEAPVAELHVAGVVKRGRVHDDVLSAKDKDEIERKMRHEVLAPLATVKLEGENGRLKLKGPSRSAELTPQLSRTDASDGAITLDGRVELSLKALGIPEVKGPLGAFKVGDAVQVTFRAVFLPTPA